MAGGEDAQHLYVVWDSKLGVGQQSSFRPQACDLQGPAGPARTLCSWRLLSDQRHPLVSSCSQPAVSDLPAINTELDLQMLTALWLNAFTSQSEVDFRAGHCPRVHSNCKSNLLLHLSPFNDDTHFISIVQPRVY